MDFDVIDGLKDIENFKSVFLESEKDNIKNLLKQPYYFNIFKRFHNKPKDYILNFLNTLIKNVELGKVPEKELDYYEGAITILLLCLCDSVLIHTTELLAKLKEEQKNRKKNTQQDSYKKNNGEEK